MSLENIEPSGGGRLRFQRLRADPEAFALTQIVARERGVALTKMLRRTRGSGHAAAARQLAIYLVHTLLGRPQDAVADLFTRDRTTIAHAVGSMEDLRDEARRGGRLLEAEIARIETQLRERIGRTAEEFDHAA